MSAIAGNTYEGRESANAELKAVDSSFHFDKSLPCNEGRWLSNFDNLERRIFSLRSSIVAPYALRAYPG